MRSRAEMFTDTCSVEASSAAIRRTGARASRSTQRVSSLM